MKILYVCGENIETPSCGCAHRSRFLYDALVELGEVTVLNPRDVPRGSLIYRLFEVPFLKLTKVAHWPFRSVGGTVQRLDNKHYDIVVCRYLLNASLVCAWKIAPCYVDIDDLPTQAFDSVEGKRLPGWMRPFCRVLVNLWQGYCLRKCAGAWAVTPDQRRLASRIVKCGCLPNLARPPETGYDVNAPQEDLLLTIGLMSYRPNYAGVDWFVDNVWPAVLASRPNCHYAVVGNGVPATLRAKWLKVPNVDVLGYVDDVNALYERASAVVVPVLSGAGSCVKVAESCLRGRFVLATREGARGYEDFVKKGFVRVFCNGDDLCEALKNLEGSGARERQYECLAYAREMLSFEWFRRTVSEIIGGVDKNGRKE